MECIECGNKLTGKQTKFCKYRCKNTHLVRKRRQGLKQKALRYKGDNCNICGYNDCIDALEFHHINPSLKEFGISKVWNSKGWKDIKKELNKCILVCSNCHKEIHYKLKQKK